MTHPLRRSRKPVPGARKPIARAVAAGALAAAMIIPAGAALAAPAPDRAVDHGRIMERLDRSPVAVKTDGGVYVGWRLLASDPASTAFQVLRDGKLITPKPLRGSTNYVDPHGTADSVYQIRAVGGAAQQRLSQRFRVWSQNHLDVPLDKPADGVTPDGKSYTYRANDASVGDVDGDGQYEIILKWDPSNSKDNSQSGYTGNVYVDAYKLDGTRLWRIDLGRNIRAGAHYTQMVVYDLDSDGKAEVMMKTADGTVDGGGTVIGDKDADYRNSAGYVLSGPEYLTVFNGKTGRAIDTVDYLPGRGNVADWGDSYGNRVDRFLAGVGYFDGKHPSAFFSRGYYTRTVVAAWDFDGRHLVQRWVFDSDEAGKQYEGQGNHNLAVADVDHDQRDEIVFGSMTLDDDGSVLYNTNLHHGDALHVGDFDPFRPGLEVFAAHEDTDANGNRGATFRSAATGEVYWSIPGIKDTGRAAMDDIDPTHPGAEGWASGSTAEGKKPELRNVDGSLVSTNLPPANFDVWWDGDLSREIADHNYDSDTAAGVPVISKWNPQADAAVPIFTATGTLTNNTTKGNPSLQADLFGDWREELMYRTADSTALRIYTTTAPTQHRLVTLMQDPVYRLGVVWQNVAYNQPPHTSYFLGTGMQTPARPDISYPDTRHQHGEDDHA
ncbi:rhamnogalacturonan lyase [Microlunatus elymi]|uniref:Rhamnogalacturonan lyase n=1 Tax=Microlunatus elymi TaxID=2596828 RepID=A0A516Q2A7_9ACTN|nr:rhamnogalacturonan lyase [Microlunatus elymi]QDP97563.1 rhamnogalacturonan lyase [Microlunatus elymi]